VEQKASSLWFESIDQSASMEICVSSERLDAVGSPTEKCLSAEEESYVSSEQGIVAGLTIDQPIVINASATKISEKNECDTT
jgi:hypothetical protein